MMADVAVPTFVPIPAVGRSRRVLAALGAVVRRGLRLRPRCLLMGHDDSFARQPRLLALRCETCGRETTGWTIGPGAPVVTAARRVPPSPQGAGVDATIRVASWTLSRRQGRAEARDRQRLRLVAAAERAAQPRPDDTGLRGTG